MGGKVALYEANFQSQSFRRTSYYQHLMSTVLKIVVYVSGFFSCPFVNLFVCMFPVYGYQVRKVIPDRLVNKWGTSLIVPACWFFPQYDHQYLQGNFPSQEKELCERTWEKNIRCLHKTGTVRVHKSWATRKKLIIWGTG